MCKVSKGALGKGRKKRVDGDEKFSEGWKAQI